MKPSYHKHSDGMRQSARDGACIVGRATHLLWRRPAVALLGCDALLCKFLDAALGACVDVLQGRPEVISEDDYEGKLLVASQYRQNLKRRCVEQRGACCVCDVISAQSSKVWRDARTN